jgi:signal transduction histidine kinase
VTSPDLLSTLLAASSALSDRLYVRCASMSVEVWVRPAVERNSSAKVTLVPGPPLMIEGDEKLLSQLLDHLITNAAEASAGTGGAVRVTWRRTGDWVEVLVEDDGPGLTDEVPLFVPLSSTRPGRMGLGLVLSRRIVEAHGGSMTVTNRPGGCGCVSRVRLPLGRG